jgi:glycosyltransferase involved in cell wall biosynthesis
MHQVTVYGVGGQNKLIRFLRMILLLRKLILENRCDVISCSDPYFLGLASYILARLYGVGLEIQVLGIEKFTILRRLIASFVIRHAGSVRVNSTHLQNLLALEFKLPQSEILFVPIHYLPGEFGFEGVVPGSGREKQQSDLKKEFAQKYGGKFNFLTVGRLVETKNIPLQLLALIKLREKHKDVHLHIVGTGVMESKIKDHIRNLDLGQNVTLHGNKVGLEMGVFYTEADCFLLSSTVEGWPMAIIDAVSADLPIVMSDVGPAGEFIKHETNGLIVPINDVASLCGAMERIMSDVELRERLTRNAKVHLENYWSLESILSGYKQSWQKALEK